VAIAKPDMATAATAMVVADEPFAAHAGLEILRQGGNAVDAAVAVAFALAVTDPRAGNLGGGGFMLIRMADGTAVVVDYRETAPAAARWDMYLDKNGNLIPNASTQGWRAAAIPGTVAGLDLALRTHGTFSLSQVLAPAIRLAEDGFQVGEKLARDLDKEAPRLSRDPESRRLLLRNGNRFRAGEIMKQKELARTLSRLAKKGARDFYEGKLAGRFLTASKTGGGVFTRDDLRHYQALLRPPLRGQLRNYEILTTPPPSSGGIALLETLNMLDPLLQPNDKPDTPVSLHLIAEALRRAFADRARYLADPNFAEIPVTGLIAKDYAARWRASIDPDEASRSAELEMPRPEDARSASPRSPAPGRTPTDLAPREGNHTTHFSVIDEMGNAVANTYTINDNFGSGIIVPGLGFLLNNTMDDFTVQPGAPNVLFDLVQSDRNKIEPGKRPLSSMTPTLVTREEKTILALGSPDGPRIISAVTEVLLYRLFFGDDLGLAVARPRIHHQWLPDALWLEQASFSQEVIDALRGRGHEIRSREHIGNVNAIERDPRTGMLTGVADGRRGGVARGY
jgi:gamma-glutamyltranspeptidase/glutathione hydrolase